MSEASYIPADSSVPFLHTPTVYLCTTSAVKQIRRRGPPDRESPGVPRTSSCVDSHFKHRQVETLSKTDLGHNRGLKIIFKILDHKDTVLYSRG